MTREARLEKATEVKSSHFILGYPEKRDNTQQKIEDEVNRQKWNPQNTLVKTDLTKTNFILGDDNKFQSMSQNRSDYQNHGSAYDPEAKAKRLALVTELRRSNLPPQHFNMPKSTAQESYVHTNTKEEEILAVQQRKADADKVFARVRGVKPNFSLGGHKLDYLSENKGSLTKPTNLTYDKTKRDQMMAT